MKRISWPLLFLITLVSCKKYLDVNKMNIVLVGDKKTILPGLKRLGYEIVELDADGNPVK